MTMPSGAIEETLRGIGGESDVSKSQLKHIITRVTDEGLIIEISISKTSPCFPPGRTNRPQVLKDLAAMLGRILPLVGKRHRHRRPYPRETRGSRR